jgi:hypothetical protein
MMPGDKEHGDVSYRKKRKRKKNEALGSKI